MSNFDVTDALRFDSHINAVLCLAYE